MGQAIIRCNGNRVARFLGRAEQRFAGKLPHRRHRAHGAFPRGVIAGLLERLLHLGAIALGAKVRGKLFDQILLQRCQFGERSVELLRPEDFAAGRLDQLRGHPQVRTRAADIAFEQITHPQLPPHCLDIG